MIYERQYVQPARVDVVDFHTTVREAVDNGDVCVVITEREMSTIVNDG